MERPDDTTDDGSKRPYVKPQLLLVQRRLDGDHLATGCKNITTSAVGGADCLQNMCNADGS